LGQTTENELKPTRTGELYLPCIMTRLVDQNPEERVERYPHAVSVSGLRQSVLQNVNLILNSTSHPTAGALGNDPEIMGSVLGMGLGDFCGVSHSRQRREQLRNDILRQLAAFEPRLDSSVTEIRFVSDEGGASSGIIDLEIRSIISVSPLKEEFAFRARLCLESGEALVDESVLNS